jgi:NAD(P)-dependent dehydrogenase (short-subunit alcohol dehydrogenase family)
LDDIHYLHQAFDSHKAYSESKLLDAMLSMDFSQRFLDAGISTDRVTCNCLDPGTVQTKMLRAGWGDYPGINVEEALGRDDVFLEFLCIYSQYNHGLIFSLTK